VAERFAQGFAHGLLVLCLAHAPAGGIAAQRDGEKRHDQHGDAEIDQRIGPAETLDQRETERRKHEHAGGTRCGAEAEDEGAFFGRNIAGKRGKDRSKGTGGDAEADEQAAADIEHAG
jgi:hypothetical protein